MAALVEVEHSVLLGVIPIGGLVGADALSCHFLGVVVSFGQLQQLHQHRDIGHELCVHPVHEPYGLHFVKCDGWQFARQL